MKKAKRNKRGRKSDKILLEVIKEQPSLSQYELARKLHWSSGHIDSSVRRLLRSNEIFLRVMERKGKRVNLVYPKEQKPLNLIEVPNKVLTIGNPVWNEQAFFYALDNITIGISGREINEWKEISAFVETTPIRKETRARNEETLLLQIPEKFWRFYDLDKKHRVVSKSGNNLLVTISGEIIETKSYPS